MTDRTELRPAETVAESVPTRHETPDVAELRRLLDAYRAASGLAPIVDAWYAVARAALAALPALLDAAADQDILIGSVNHYKAERDALAANLAHMTEARDNARAEVERLSEGVAEVRALHASSGDEESQGYLPGGGYGFIAPYCTGCEASDEYAVAWPCPTIRAIGGEQS